MSNFQPVVFKTTQQYSRDIQVIDSYATRIKLEYWLNESEDTVQPIHIDVYASTKTVETTPDYPIEVRVVGDGYYQKGSKQYRVYVREYRGGLKRFVQSSKEGFIDMAKVVALVNEVVTDNNAAYERAWEGNNRQQGFEKRIAAANKELKGTGFKLRNHYRNSFKIEKEDGFDFNEADIEKVVAKLLTLK